MVTCSKCGSAVSDGATFCGVCGTPVSSVNTPPAPPVQATSAGMTSNVAGALAYLFGFITGIIFLVLEPYKRDPFVRFHAFQSIFYNIAMIVVMIVWNIITGIMALALGFLGMLFGLLGTLIGLAFFVYWIFLMYKAYNKEEYKIPFIGDFAAKQAGQQA
jgi:uncharacterized membrane protein